MARDPELTQILLQELGRHLVALDELGLAPDPEALGDARRTVHALKGSAGLAGEAELAATMARLERRLREGDPDALGATVEAVRHAIERLELASARPEPGRSRRRTSRRVRSTRASARTTSPSSATASPASTRCSRRSSRRRRPPPTSSGIFTR